jgi:hypothetical protein
MPSGYIALESSAFATLLIWAMARPYEFRSDELTTDTVCLLFYRAKGGGVLMHMFGLLGLPVTSVSVVAGNSWLHLVRKEPTVVKEDLSGVPWYKLRRGIGYEKYFVVDTGVPVTTGIKIAIDNIEGSPVRTASSLWLRLRCIATLKPLLSMLGAYYTPRNIFEQIPAIYFYRLTGNRRG